MSAILLQGRELAQKIKQKLKEELDLLTAQIGRSPHLVAVQVGHNEASEIYLRAQRRNCEQLGITYTSKNLPFDSSEEELISLLKELNNNDTIDGIIIQEPLPAGYNRLKVISAISADKDVEGIHPENLGKIVLGNPIMIPSTASAIMELLNCILRDYRGREVVIIGHSAIVGKPLALLLLDKLATVSICHIGTFQAGRLQDHVRQAEILIVAVGKPYLIKGDWIKEGAIVIDVGINKVEDKIVGDVEFSSAKERASYITPVPGGVGPLTVAMLLKNLLKSFSFSLNK